MGILYAIIVFSVLVIIHELGHFLLAKKNGVCVTEFSVGMGPRLISFVKGETRYSWKLLPLGGSCMMLGEDEDVDNEKAFRNKSVWARISVVAAGPIFNFLLAFVLAMIVVGFVGYDPAEIVAVKNNLPAANAGIEVGDTITEINGSNVDIGRDVSTYFYIHPVDKNPVTITYERDGKSKTVKLNPVLYKSYMLGFTYNPDDNPAVISALSEEGALAKAGVKADDIITSIDGTAIASGNDLQNYITTNPLSDKELAIIVSRDGEQLTFHVTPVFMGESYTLGFTPNLAREKTNALGVIKYSYVEVKYFIVTTVKSIGMIFKGKVSADDVAGPVGIVDIIGDTYQQSKSDGMLYVFLNMSYLSIMLSANLGVMNLLPLPALDGGRLVFLIIEAVRRKPVAREKEGMVHFIGMVLLMLLMVFIMYNDIRKLF